MLWKNRTSIKRITKIIKAHAHLFEITVRVPGNLHCDCPGHLEIARTISVTQHIHSHSQSKDMEKVI